MTAAAREWAWAQRLPESRNGVATHAKVILLFLAERCDSTGTCWPSVAAIADATGVSRRSFIRLIDWLVSLELIERDRRHDADGRRKSNLYRLRLSAKVTPSKVTPRHLGLSVTEARPSATEARPSATVTPESNQEPFKNPSGGHARTRATLPPETIDITDKLLDLGRKLGMDRRTLEAEVDKCLDWHRARGKKRVDWQATLRNWLKKTVEFQGERKNGKTFPAEPPGIIWPPADDFYAWRRFAKQHGIHPQGEESEQEFMHRVRIRLSAGRRYA